MPDPRLSECQQTILEGEYGMLNGALTITTRAALANYYLQYLRIDHAAPREQPEAQQLILENIDQIKPWLF